MKLLILSSRRPAAYQGLPSSPPPRMWPVRTRILVQQGDPQPVEINHPHAWCADEVSASPMLFKIIVLTASACSIQQRCPAPSSVTTLA